MQGDPSKRNLNPIPSPNENS